MTGVEIIGAASGLASSFNTTITWFDYVLVAKQAAPRLQSLLVKLDDAQLRLARWGKAAGLTGVHIRDEESLKDSGSLQLDETQQRQAIRTFLAVAAIFDECQKLCHGERHSKDENDPSIKENEISPFDAPDVDWNPMHKYLHQKMQDIIDGRKNKVSVAQRIKFAFYKERHIEKLIRDINDHVDQLYSIYTPPAKVQEQLGRSEVDELFQVAKELSLVSERDPVLNSAIQNILGQKNDVPIRNEGNINVGQQGKMIGGNIEAIWNKNMK